MELKDISRYRTKLMGMAICMIMICHNTVEVPDGVCNIIKSIISNFCQGGGSVFSSLWSWLCFFLFEFDKFSAVL